MTCTRRDFLGLSCGSYLALAWAGAGLGARRAFAKEPDAVIGRQKWGYLEKLGDGLYASIATPQGDFTTVSNGGIIAGTDRVLAIEGFNTAAGAHWQATAAENLVGRLPTHVALTHYHPDHSNGLAGYRRGGEAPAILATRKTRSLLVDKHKTPPPADGDKLVKAQPVLLPDTMIPDAPITIDLGGRRVVITPRAGHTPSDVTIALEDPRVVFCGDLFFNGVFPYFADATPSVLTKTMETLLAEKWDVYVPGHGPRTDGKGVARYVAMLRHVEEAARKAVAKGTPAAEAWKTYDIPKSLGTWGKFRPDVYRFAFEAWERELKK